MTRRTTQNNVYTHTESRFPTQQGNYTSSRVCARPGCYKPFIPNKRWQRYCSPECHNLYWKELRRRASEMDRAGESGSELSREKPEGQELVKPVNYLLSGG
jgi:hypothetical protein